MARRSNQKRRRDPNAPTKGRTTWQMFSSDNREELKKQNPGLSSAEISKKLGEMWRESDDATKRRYEQQYQMSQAEYQEKMTAYRAEQKIKRSQSSKSKKNNNNNNNTGGRSKKGNSKNNDDANEDNDQQ